jgi:uncharacterized UPF0160 family protein
MNYTWKITGIKTKNNENLTNIIVQTYWKKIGTDENENSVVFDGATPFDLSTVDPDNFISYENLTEEMVISWIQSVVIGEYEEHVNEQINKQIQEKVNPIIEVSQEFPWSTNIE